MLSKLLFVRLKAAENALRDGRLDEAHRLATAPDLRDHRRGRAVLADLAERFVERARSHFRADRFSEALMDLDKAEAGAAGNDHATELRQHIQTVMIAHRDHERSRQDRLAEARRRIEQGSLIAGRHILGDAAKDDAEAGYLQREVDRRIEDAQRTADQAEQMIAQGQLRAAADRVRKAKSIDAQSRRVLAVEARLCTQVVESARAAVAEGRMQRAADELKCLGPLGAELPVRREVEALLSVTHQAIVAVAAGDYGEARRHALSVKRLLPQAGWIDAAVEQLRQLDELRTALSAGPLGDRLCPRPVVSGQAVRHVAQPGAKAHTPGRFEETIALPRTSGDPGSLPRRLLLLVDGGGSYLIVRGGQASLGRVASDKPADVPLYSDVAERHANLQRVDDDYFLFAAREVEVGGRRTQHALLRDGDRIVLGRKAKMTFRLPTRKSPTAILDLSDTTKMPNDVRRVVLFDRQAMIGDGPHAHIRCRHAGPPLVLFERGGDLWIRQQGDGHVNTDAVQLTLGEQVEVAGASVVIQRWDTQTPGVTRV